MALVDQNITSTWTLDARQLIGELERTKGAMGGVEQAAQRTTVAANNLARSKAGIRDQMRPMGEQLEKIRTAFGLAGLSMNTATGAAGAWLQAGVKIIAQGGGLAAAFTAVGLGVGKLVEHLRAAEENAKRLAGAGLFFGISPEAVEAVRQSFEGIEEKAAVALARIATEAKLSGTQIETLASVARRMADTTGQSIEQAFSATVDLHKRSVPEVEGLVARARTEHAFLVMKLEEEEAQLRAIKDTAGPAYNEQLVAVRRLREEVQGATADLRGMEEIQRLAEERAAEDTARQAAGFAERASRRAAEIRRSAQRAGLAPESFDQFKERIQGDVFEEQAREQIEREERLAADIEAVEEESRQRRFQATLRFMERKEAEERKAAARAQKIEEEAAAQRIAVASAYFDTALSGTRQLVAAFGAGTREQTKEALLGVARQAAVEAAFMSAKALFLLALGQAPQAGVAFAAAGAMASVAAAAGVASAVVPGGGGGGGAAATGGGFGGGVGGGTSPSSFGGTPSTGGGGGEAAPNVTVVFNTRGFVTEAEVGKAIDRALQEHRRLRGA